MTTNRKSTLPVVFLAVLALTGPSAYLTGYFGLCKITENDVGTLRCRCYPQKWQVNLFKPAGWVERRATGVKVVITNH